MGGIFVSYRRDDSRHAAGRLLDRLRQTYEPHQLFMDVDDIAPGLDFVKVIEEQVAACDVMLVVIGPDWLDARDDEGACRLDNPSDFVRFEVEVALSRNVRVIPVLVDGASMPREGALPEPLRLLARRQSLRLTHERFGSEADNLVQSLRHVVWPAGKQRREATATLESRIEHLAPRPPPLPAIESDEGEQSGGKASGGSTTSSMLRPLAFGVAGLIVGCAIYAGSTFLVGRLTTAIFGIGPSRQWAILLFGPLAIIWSILMVWSARSARSSAFWWVTSATSCAAASCAVTVLGIVLVYPFNAPANPALGIAIGVALGCYVLAVRLYLWKAIVGR